MKKAIEMRLATYKNWANDHKTQKDWRKFTWVNNKGRKGYKKTEREFTHAEGKIYADDFSVIGEKVADAHEIINLRHTGWFSDNFENGLIRGAVVKLRTSRGTLYIPATYCTEWDGITLYIESAENVAKGLSEGCHEGAKVRGAYLSDSYAEREAERARDDDAKSQAESRIDDLRYEIAGIVADTKQTIKAIREQQAGGAIVPKICQLLRESLKESREELKDKVRYINELKTNYWLAVQ